MAQTNIPSTGLWGSIAALLNTMFSELFGSTGLADYGDTQYTSVSPFQLTDGVIANLPNNALNTYDEQKPTDVTTFYDGSTITGRNGDGLLITFDFKATPRAAGTTEVEVYLDITGGTGTPANLAKLYPRLITFNKGVGVEKPINFTFSAYTRDTWELNGAVVKVVANGACDVYDIRYVITRTHKAR